MYFKYRRTFKTFIVVIVTMLLAGVFLTGCNAAKTQTQAVKPSDNSTTTTPATTTPPVVNNPESTSPQSVKLTLYFPNAEATGLVATNRTVVVTDQEVIKAMFKELLTPPSGLEKPLPQGTTLLSASVSADGVATLNLSKEFQKNFHGGSSGELMTMYSIVNTLTTLPTIQSVQFLLEGKKLDGILGNLDTSLPLKPNTSLIMPK
ncbi:GerMN domain-containing protein [Desulfosporosinus sp. Sb-LF]|uniref:GerMN domain-containing protein n=1 Tax=Desulfosporosinus sp. Sb-LF TaxID=2560027 RepID=UPI00107F7F4B|nr:GerMN domain-containing protein [Desulfosporosinus sp. Sb-LF]TGE32566.1 spore gernimation protein [Desulfosporosinus sp. Sb-LF]